MPAEAAEYRFWSATILSRLPCRIRIKMSKAISRLSIGARSRSRRHACGRLVALPCDATTARVYQITVSKAACLLPSPQATTRSHDMLLREPRDRPTPKHHLSTVRGQERQAAPLPATLPIIAAWPPLPVGCDDGHGDFGQVRTDDIRLGGEGIEYLARPRYEGCPAAGPHRAGDVPAVGRDQANV